MCLGGGGGGGGFDLQAAQQQAAQQAASAAQLAEQQREFDATQAQDQQTLANEKALQDANQAQVDQQAALTNTWETGRANEQATATKSIDDAFAQFTPDYYSKYTKAYTDNYTPQIQRQYDLASNQTLYGLARSGNLQSQTSADQIANLAQEKGQATADVNNAAVGATTTLQNNVLNAKQNLMQQATSDATLGSPVTPGSADAITANFNDTANQLTRLSNQAGDAVTTLQATPQYGGLGQLFSNAASGANAYLTGSNNYAFANAAAAANPSGTGTYRVGS